MTEKLAPRAAKRIEKEIEKFIQDPTEGLRFASFFITTIINDSLYMIRLEVQSPSIWLMHIEGASGTIYAGEKYTLKIRFTDDYPMDSPEVVFIPPSPVHSHVYSNGHICLNILGISVS